VQKRLLDDGADPKPAEPDGVVTPLMVDIDNFRIHGTTAKLLFERGANKRLGIGGAEPSCTRRST